MSLFQFYICAKQIINDIRGHTASTYLFDVFCCLPYNLFRSRLDVSEKHNVTFWDRTSYLTKWLKSGLSYHNALLSLHNIRLWSRQNFSFYSKVSQNILANTFAVAYPGMQSSINWYGLIPYTPGSHLFLSLFYLRVMSGSKVLDLRPTTPGTVRKPVQWHVRRINLDLH